MHSKINRMDRIISYIRQSLQGIYPPQELKSLTMMICCDMLGLSAIDLYLRKDIKLSENKQCELESIISRLQKNEPVQYIRGTAVFCGLPFHVAPGVLIPRPETVELVDLIVTENPGASRILDIGTGSGCIAISLSHKLPQAVVSAWEVSEEALAIARSNNEVLGTHVAFEKKDVLNDPCFGLYDIIVSNPPYITEKEREDMEPNVLDWEPELALFVPDDDPLRFYRHIALLALDMLPSGGKLYFEINRAYGTEIVCMLRESGYNHIRVLKDFYGNDRIVTANR